MTREQAQAILDQAEAARSKMVRMIPIGQLWPADTERWNAVNKAVDEARLAMKPFYAADMAEKERLEAERLARYAQAEDTRIAGLPVKQRRNGWCLATDGARWYVKDPNTGESIYNGSLARCREVADECKPDSVSPVQEKS